jgi:hypothetical protein
MTDEPIDPGSVVLVAMAELRGIPADAWTDGPVFDRTVRLDRALAMIDLLNDAIRDIELSLIDSMEEDELVVPAIGVLKREEKSTSSWRDGDAGRRMREDLASAVAAEVALDVATGELDQMKRNVAMATMRAAYEAIPSFSSLKVAGRTRLGLDIGDYRRVSTYYSVSLTRGEES